MARRLLAQQPNPPRHVSIGDLIEIHGPTIFYALVVVPLLFVGYITIRPGQPLPIDVTIRFAGFIVLVVALFLTYVLLSLRKTLREGVAATGEIVDATRTAGRVRVEINGDAVDRAYRSGTFEQFAPGDRITVLIDPRKETVLLALGRVRS